MRFSDVVRLAKEYLTLGIAAAIILTVLLSVGYFFVYKRLMKGSKKFSKRTAALTLISICYLFIVFGAVFFSRGSFFSSYSLQPFYSYIEAWNQWSISGWRNIILNILMFVPFGFLLPLWHKRLQKAWLTVLCGFLFSLIIELIQLVGSLGVFETDDLINNTFGAWLGYGAVMLVLMFFHRQKRSTAKLFGYAAPMLVMILAFGSIFTVYSMKELGNLRSDYIYKMNMKGVELTSEVELSRDSNPAGIYQAAFGDEQAAKALASSVFSAIGATMDEEETKAYDESVRYIAYKPDNHEASIHMWVNYKGLTYRLTDFSQFDDHLVKVKDADELTIRGALAELELELPANISFSVMEDGSYIFTANMLQVGNQIWDGVLRCSYYSDGTIKEIDNNIVIADYYRSGEIISEFEAYDRLSAGKFFHHNRQRQTKSITVRDVSLIYELDSKGFYQPVYRFECVFADEVEKYELTIAISALK